jgi:serine/threonine protein kinase
LALYPSPELTERLHKLGLCHEGDLRACRPQIKQLARDLPTFDTLWLDALVQLGKLTPYQAKILTRNQDDQLSIGDYQILDVDHQEEGHIIYQAQHKNSKLAVLIDTWDLRDDQRGETLRRLEALQKQLQLVKNAAIPTILQLIEQDQKVHVVTLRPHGPHLKEILVRRGRFKPRLVLEIARQIFHGLQTLHQFHLVHGDVRLRNISLDRNGRVTLLCPGLLNAIYPQFTIHHPLPAECYEGLAPELNHVHGSRSQVSDLYAVGCLLWELLAGRPPILSANPLQKLIGHQQGRIKDVNEWAFDTPQPLNQLVHYLVQTHPQHRPGSAKEALAIIGPIASPARGVISQYLSSIQIVKRTRRTAQWRISKPQLAAAMVVMVVTTGALLGRHYQVEELWKTAKYRLELAWGQSKPASSEQGLNIASSVPNLVPANGAETPPWAQATSENTGAGSGNSQALTPISFETSQPLAKPGDSQMLPSPDANGVVSLKAGETYVARNISLSEPLLITTVDAQTGVAPATIVLTQSAWEIQAPAWTLQNVTLMSLQAPRATTPTVAGTNSDLEKTPAAIQSHCSQVVWKNVTWKGQDQAEEFALLKLQESVLGINQVQELEWENVKLIGQAHGISLSPRIQSVSVLNSLKIGRGAFFVYDLGVPSDVERQIISLEQTTLRQADQLLKFYSRDTSSGTTALVLKLQRNVFDLTSQGCVLDCLLSASAFPMSADQFPDLELEGAENLLAPGSQLARITQRPQLNGPLRSLPLELPAVGGIQVSVYSFRGNSLRMPEDSILKTYEGPKLSPVLPGFQGELKPGESSDDFF